MEYGFNVPVSGPLATPADITTIAQRGEQLGYRLLAIPDHIVVPKTIGSRYPYSKSGEFEVDARAGDHLEPLALMAHLAGITTEARLLTSVMVVPYRHPVLTAKLVSTIDLLSRGRVVLGVGAGWMAEEFPPVGAPAFADRGARDGRVSADLQDTVDRRRPVIRGRVRFVQRHHVRAEAGSEAASPHLGRW